MVILKITLYFLNSASSLAIFLSMDSALLSTCNILDFRYDRCKMSRNNRKEMTDEMMIDKRDTHVGNLVAEVWRGRLVLSLAE